MKFVGKYGEYRVLACLLEQDIGLCNIFSVKVCRRFHWDDEISLSS